MNPNQRFSNNNNANNSNASNKFLCPMNPFRQNTNQFSFSSMAESYHQMNNFGSTQSIRQNITHKFGNKPNSSFNSSSVTTLRFPFGATQQIDAQTQNYNQPLPLAQYDFNFPRMYGTEKQSGPVFRFS
jgi:hypothetical protein